MWYFFDESGNWQELENRRLVIGGIVIKNSEDLKEIENKIKEFKFERGFKNLHANEMTIIDREAFLRIILKLLQEERFKALLYVINPDILIQTQKESDEIYAEIASDLLVEIAFGDDNIEVEYDMKFHYAYPAQIIENIENQYSSDEFNQMKRNFYLNENAFKYQKNRIKNIILRSKKNIPNFNEIIYRLGNRRFLYNYLWEEFRLKIEKGALIREKFKEKFETKLKEKYKLFNLKQEPKISIEYKGKHNQHEGVEIIDFLTNIVRFHGKTPRYYSPAITKDIYEFIEIKEKNA